MKHIDFKSTILSGMFLMISSTISAQNLPFFPTGITSNTQGELFMSEKTNNRITVYSPDAQSMLRSYTLTETPTGITSFQDKLYVTTFGQQGKLHILQVADGKELAAVETGSGACAPLYDEARQKIYVCNQFENTVSEIDAVTHQLNKEVAVLREPRAMALSKDGKYLFVNNFLPAQRADLEYVGACVSVIETATFTKVKDIKLANGSNALRGICLSGDGKYMYVSHNLGRYNVPTSQLQQGWMNTSAFSIIDVDKQEFLGAVLVDEPERGAAGIWSIACANQKIFISHSGTHEVSIVQEPAMLEKFLAQPDKQKLEYDLTFLSGIRQRLPLEGNGPRAMCLTGQKLVVPTYFADVLNFVDVSSNALTSVNLNPNRTESDIHKGEKYFNDASHCFQNWQSCNGCHPGEARNDGMNWDLLNDGIGNPKNCKSLILSHPTKPSMITGIRETAEWAVRAGFKFIQFCDISEEDACCVDAYLKSLHPVPSPYLVDGQLSEKAKVGKRLFDKWNCSTCHTGEYYTDLQMHVIGKDVEFEKGWDTPTLREVWRTGPYLFDGRAATLKEVFSVHRHGIEDRKVTDEEIDALTEYVKSL